ncbi:MAG: hypothetical protein IPN44_12795 [Flavobacteriales bacterium]|nr:hypothetical protein [Flavobacteriales bacterium]
MRHKTNATSNDPLLDMVERGDLELLMRAVPASLLGHIMQLNRLPRYHNRLDAILLAVRIEELRSLENGRAANFR